MIQIKGKYLQTKTPLLLKRHGKNNKCDGKAFSQYSQVLLGALYIHEQLWNRPICGAVLFDSIKKSSTPQSMVAS
jgi:hypothetical protein